MKWFYIHRHVSSFSGSSGWARQGPAHPHFIVGETEAQKNRTHLNSGLLLLIGSSSTTRNPSFYNFHLLIYFSSQVFYRKKNYHRHLILIMITIITFLHPGICHLQNALGAPTLMVSKGQIEMSTHPPSPKLCIRCACGMWVRVQSVLHRVWPTLPALRLQKTASAQIHIKTVLFPERAVQCFFLARSSWEHSKMSGAWHAQNHFDSVAVKRLISYHMIQ